MLINGQDFSPEKVREIQAMIERDPVVSRRGLSLRVCERLDWKSPNGRWKEMSCRVALLKLQRQGLLELPQCHAMACKELRRHGEARPSDSVNPVCCSLDALGGVDLVAIDNRWNGAAKTWKALMRTHHYLGAGPLCGSQMRYLIRSASYGWLGGLAFSAAAWQLGPRDRWIGWSAEARREHLVQVVCNSRFLILPQVHVPNLASHILAVAAGRLGRDWVERYGVTPVLLETFVERDRFAGTCYRAANWQYLGTTQGRGRQDRSRMARVPIKDIYVYPLAPSFREILRGPTPVSTAVVKCPRRQADPEEVWPEEEFGQIDLGDQRLTNRLVTIVGDFLARPERSIPKACQSRARTKAVYRFLDHPGIDMEKILKPHYQATLERLREEKVILAVQDTTTLNYTAHPSVQNLGPIGYRLEKGVGLILHDTMAYCPDGVALGLLHAQCWARDPEDFGKKRRRHELPIEQKESHKWLTSFRQVAEAQKQCPKTVFVSVGDREADIYELFALADQGESNPKLLVRASHDRLLGEGQGHLWDRVAQQEISGIQELNIPRKGSRPARVARLQIRFAQVSLTAPARKAKLRDLSLWAVLAREADPPAGVEPLEWMLLTTMAVNSFEQAVEKLAWYTIRWQIEVFHRTLKTGCKIEDRQLGTADRIETCLAIDMVVAWRIVHLVRLGRKVPNVSCEIYFEEAQWKALVAYLTRNPTPPEKPPTLREAIRMVGQLGGHLGRKTDGEPGTESLWTGLQRLDDMTAMYKVMTGIGVPHVKKPTVSSKPDYG
jgi:hypothetical protein